MEQTARIEQADTVELELSLLRSAFVDAFARLETSICKILASCGAMPSNEPFKQRLKDFQKAEKTHLIAKSNYTKRDQIAVAVDALLSVRADIVHSEMRIANVNGEPTAFFVNAKDAAAEYPCTRLLSLNQFKELIYKTKCPESRVVDLSRVNPPSSQPQPSRDAAGDL